MPKSDAISLKELNRLNHKKFNQRGLNCILYLIDHERDPNDNEIRYLFLLKCLEKTSNNSGHIVTVKFAKESAKGGLKSRPANDDCRVHCQCPAFIYWGPAYNSTTGDYNLDVIENRPPDIRDPERKVKICKHISRVARMVDKISYTTLNKKAGISVQAVKKAVLDLEVIPVDETFPSLISYLERFRTDVNPQEFCASLNRSNYESKLLSIGAIV